MKILEKSEKTSNFSSKRLVFQWMLSAHVFCVFFTFCSYGQS